VALGGSLVQDIPSQWAPASASAAPIMHNGAWVTANRSDSLHTVCVEPGTRLAAIIHAGDLGVNSFHHQAVNRLAPDAVVSARSEDGVIEAIELDGHPFCLGVQWHPEEMAAVRPDMQALFDAFVSACAGRKS
jgi:putative glutamine amidotransferase